MNRPLLTTLALAGLVALTGCADLGVLGGNDRYGDYRHDDRRYGDYGRRGYDARRIDRDAAVYANEIDRYLRISNREERAIRDVLVRRTYQQLDRRREYPFPRHAGRARGFWNRADRDIERILDRRYREPYRYYNRYGARRYQEYYRYRRYDERRGWYNTRDRYDREDRDDRYRDGRRGDRREADRQRDRREDRRRAERQRDRREEARRDRARREDRRRPDRQRDTRDQRSRRDNDDDEDRRPRRRGNNDDD